MKANLISLGCYLGFGVAITYMAPGEWETSQFVAYFALIALALVIDLRSYLDGLKRGTEIANEVLADVCKEKKVRLVRYE